MPTPPVGYYKRRGKTHPVHARTGVSKVNYPRNELHPFVGRPSLHEPVLTTSQKLTLAQKEHLGQFQNREQLLGHLAGFHGQTFSGLKETELSHPIDPQVRERFGLPDRPITSDETLRLRHLQEHLENLEERARTSSKRKALSQRQFEMAGVDIPFR